MYPVRVYHILHPKQKDDRNPISMCGLTSWYYEDRKHFHDIPLELRTAIYMMENHDIEEDEKCAICFRDEEDFPLLMLAYIDEL